MTCFFYFFLVSPGSSSHLVRCFFWNSIGRGCSSQVWRGFGPGTFRREGGPLGWRGGDIGDMQWVAVPWEMAGFNYLTNQSHRIRMYAIYGNIYHQYTPNVSIYTIHGSYSEIRVCVCENCSWAVDGMNYRFFRQTHIWRHMTNTCGYTFQTIVGLTVRSVAGLTRLQLHSYTTELYHRRTKIEICMFSSTRCSWEKIVRQDPTCSLCKCSW